MEFIARAGALIDRGHRVIGILLVVIIVQLLLISNLAQDRGMLQNQLRKMAATQSIYVVPNSQANIYKPAKGELLLSTFADYVTQSLLTYTPANLSPQYKKVREFFSPKMLMMADEYYRKEIANINRESRSSLFIADRKSTELTEFRELTDKTTDLGARTYEVVVKGVQNTIIGGTVVYANKLHVKLHLQETLASENNPFGFIITKMEQTKVKER